MTSGISEPLGEKSARFVLASSGALQTKPRNEAGDLAALGDARTALL
jgi:hypothetical protein